MTASPSRTVRLGQGGRTTAIAAVFGLALILASGPRGSQANDRVEEQFGERVQPLLEQYCFGCHGLGMKKGGVNFDGEEALQHNRKLWWAVLKNVRAGLMPPPGKPRPTDEERRQLEDWIKFGAFQIDPDNPDPGRITVRRLNRVEYRNTIRDLMGVDFDTTSEFPPDDTGHGFDNIGDVLSISPLLLEKYLAAARAIVSRAVPASPGAPAEVTIPGQKFHGDRVEPKTDPDAGVLSLSYYEPAKVSTTVKAEHDGRYALVLELQTSEKYLDGMFDYNKCRLVFKADGRELHRKDYGRREGKPFRFEFEQEWKAGPHELTIELEPLTPGEKQVRSLAMKVLSVTVRGPFDPRYFTRPANYARFFPSDVPAGLGERNHYARQLLGQFAARAFRRPVDEETKDRLVALAEYVSAQEGQTFEAGIGQAMVAVLASPRFLFREEAAEPESTGLYPLVDEYALASRLSYFLWSTMPDDELMRLAGQHKLRANLSAQVKRMLADKRSGEFMRHFVGQWLQARDIETVLINAFAVVVRDQPPDPEREHKRERFRELNRKPPKELTDAEKAELKEIRETFFRGFRRFREFELTGDLRRSMRRETEMTFEYVVRNDRSLLELLDADYTFLNEKLAKCYGIEGVKGDEMRRVTLPPESPRGGILTQGTVLAVTSNPDRTSPVKRGLFILDNILGTPPAPPPPNLPTLEEVGKKFKDRTPTLRETLELHRSQPLCMSCHKRMDPLGLALENFNALGRWRDKERGHPVDAAGTLITGEPFDDIRQLKRVLVKNHRRDFYRCLSEKLLTYAVGRGLEDYDVQTVDTLVDRLEQTGGSASALLTGIIESVPFQRCRRVGVETAAGSESAEEQADDSRAKPGSGP